MKQLTVTFTLALGVASVMLSGASNARESISSLDARVTDLEEAQEALVDEIISQLPQNTGEPGLHCWDLNGDGIEDDNEDVNEDGVFDALDCIGEIGPTGERGEPGRSLYSTYQSDVYNVQFNDESFGRCQVGDIALSGGADCYPPMTLIDSYPSPSHQRMWFARCHSAVYGYWPPQTIVVRCLRNPTPH